MTQKKTIWNFRKLENSPIKISGSEPNATPRKKRARVVGNIVSALRAKKPRTLRRMRGPTGPKLI
jgi:hypothetical protein